MGRQGFQTARTAEAWGQRQGELQELCSPLRSLLSPLGLPQCLSLSSGQVRGTLRKEGTPKGVRGLLWPLTGLDPGPVAVQSTALLLSYGCEEQDSS